MFLFVYGSLMRNEENHHFLKEMKAKFVTKGEVKGKLYDLGVGFPALTEEEGYVYGELYEIDEASISLLDQLEGYDSEREEDSLYVRKKVVIRSFSKQNYQAEVYYMSQKKLKEFFAVYLEGGRWS